MRKNKINKIRKAAFIYLSQKPRRSRISDILSYSVRRSPQLGLQYLCAVLDRKTIKTDIFDQTVSSFDLDWLIKRLREYDMAGFYCSDSHEDKVKKYCKEIKENLSIPVLVGGPGTLANSTYLDCGCDIVVHGEGEITIQQIVEYYNGERALEHVKGISYKNNGRSVKAPHQQLIENIDELSFPDRSKIDIGAYYDYFLFGMARPYISMAASRGCIHRCTFCNAFQIWDNKYRRRSVDNVISEIDAAVKRYNVKYISFQDDIFGISDAWIEEFCMRLIKKPYKIRWMVIFHPLSLKCGSERILRLMRRAGCDSISFGLQSACSDILKGINRDPSESVYLKNILRLTNKLGFTTDVSYVFGLPGETRETVHTTIDYSLNCGSTLSQYHSLSRLKGSEIEKTSCDKKICELSEDELRGLAIYAYRRFYTKPKVILNLAYFISKNPKWFIRMAGYVPLILMRIGFSVTRGKVRQAGRKASFSDLLKIKQIKHARP